MMLRTAVLPTTATALFICLAASLRGQSGYTVTTIAGPGDFGENGPASSAWLPFVGSTAVDSAGNLYIGHSEASRIWRVDASGMLRTFAGTIGLSGDDIAFDSAGNLYVADTYHDRIQRISPAGAIATIAGTGERASNGDGGPAIAAALYEPTGLAVDGAGNVYFAEYAQYRARRITPGGIINTIAGTGVRGDSGDGGSATAAQFSCVNPALAADAAGNLFIADCDKHRVRRVAPDGTITTFAGNGGYGSDGDGGPANAAKVQAPTAVAADRFGNVYIASFGRIRRVDSSGIITAFAGGGYTSLGDGGSALNAHLSYPTSLSVDTTGNLYISDWSAGRIRRVTLDRIINTVAGSNLVLDGGPATSARLYLPAGIAFHDGNLYIADSNNNRVRRVNPAGVISTVAGNGNDFGPDAADGTPATAARLMNPETVAVDSAGNLFVAEDIFGHIWRITPGGSISIVVDELMGQTHVGTLDAGDNLYFTLNNQVRKRTPAGVVTTVAGTNISGFAGDGGPATTAKLNAPRGMAVDSAGNLYIADTGNNRVRRVDPSGIITTVAGTGARGDAGDGGPATSAQLTEPYTVALDRSGTLYIVTRGLRGVRRVAVDGTISSLTSYYWLTLPEGLAIDDSGSIYVSRTYDHVVVKFTPSATPYTVTTVPAGLSLVVDGTTATSPQGYNWTAGSTHTLSVTSPQGSGDTRCLFANWSDGGAATHTVVAGAPATYTATFTTEYRLTRTAAPAASGAVTASPDSVDGFYTAGAVVQLTAVPAGGYAFSNWTGAITGAANPASITMSAPRSVTANFFVSNTSADALRFVPVLPCRAVDTRADTGKAGYAGTRDFTLAGLCGVPAEAQAYSLNVSAIPRTASLGFLALWPAGQTQPAVSTLNSLDGRVKANAALVPAGAGGAVSVYVSDPSDVFLDVNGYFVSAASAPSAPVYYHVTPCRVLDTRTATGKAGFSGSQTIPMTGACGLPGGAQAYSLNFTVIPRTGSFSYLAAWPTGQPQPPVSTLNAFAGAVTANAAIVPAGAGGSIDVFHTDSADLLVDVNGYFATPGAGGLSFYTVTPCRTLDTRNDTGKQGFSGTRDHALPAGGCALPPASAYSLNATVLPRPQLDFLTLWATGGTQPGVSTLNSFDGSVVSNAAIVPASASGSVSAYHTQNADLLLDVNGYFAP